MGSLPAFQFYPADWRTHPGIQALSFEDRGVWFEILCILHESPRRGVLLLPNGARMSDEALSRIIGLPLRKLVKALDRIAAVGVSDKDPETGALMNRRMVKDEHLRQVRAHVGRLGGNPNLLNQNPNQNPSKPQEHLNQAAKQNPTPSSSSSSSYKKELPSVVPKKAKAAVSEVFEISDAMWDWAVNAGFTTTEVKSQTARMVDHFRANGEKRLDWVAQWRNWMRKSREFARRIDGPQTPEQRKVDTTRSNSESLLTRIAQQIGSGLPRGVEPGNPGSLSGGAPALLADPAAAGH